MMRVSSKISAIAVLACLAAEPAKAEPSPWDLCATVGYFMGSQSLFLAGLAQRQAERKRVNCLVDQRHAYFVGKETAALVFSNSPLADPATFPAEQKTAFDNATRFQEEVNDAILKLMNSGN